MACVTGQSQNLPLLALRALGYDAWTLKFGMASWIKGYFGAQFMQAAIAGANYPSNPEPPRRRRAGPRCREPASLIFQTKGGYIAVESEATGRVETVSRADRPARCSIPGSCTCRCIRPAGGGSRPSYREWRQRKASYSAILKVPALSSRVPKRHGDSKYFGERRQPAPPAASERRDHALKTRIILMSALSWCLAVSTSFASETLHILVMAPTTAAQELPKYEALSAYLKSVNPLLGDIKLRVADDYPDAARFFKAEGVEGMFSGSFVAAVFIAKGYARPVARPLRADGVSTYGASIVAKAGTPPFGGIADLKGKRVAACPLATAGDVYLRSLLGPGKKPEDVFTPVPVASHQAALEAVAGGAADYAVVKSTVFVPESYPGLALVGSDAPGNPDNTFIMTRSRTRSSAP